VLAAAFVLAATGEPKRVQATTTPAGSIATMVSSV
jgi:hypothetical protein